MISVQNVTKTKVPKQYQEYVADVKKAVKTGLYNNDKEVKIVIDNLIAQINIEISEEAKKVEKKKPSSKSKNKPKPKTYNSVKTLPIGKVNTDESRFQNRKKLNKTIVSNIVNNFNETNLDPLIVWLDPKDKKYYILAGHHRFEALKELNFKDVPVKIANSDYPNEADAIRFAKEESNANRSLEKPYERAEIYRKDRLKGITAKKIEEKASIEGRNRTFILNLSHLNPKGKLMQNIIQFDNSTSVQDTREIEKIADWVGQARRNYDMLTDAHETEMYDFLKDKNLSKRTPTKASFLQQIVATAGGFDFDPEKPLNLKRFKYESEGEKAYNNEVEEIKTKISEAQNNIQNIKSRFIDPISPEYIDPSKAYYDEAKKVADNKISDYNIAIKKYQSELGKLYANKRNFINAGTNQAALFGVKGLNGNYEESLNFNDLKSSPIITEDVIIYDDDENILETKQPQPTPGAPGPAPTRKPMRKSKKVRSMAAEVTQKGDFYNVPGEVGKFLQAVERKPVHSVVITMDGEQGAGKTTTLYKFMEDFANGQNPSLFLSLEEHPDSSLAMEKVHKYISPKNRNYIDTVGEVESVKELYDLVEDYDVIFIDSWQKLLRQVGKIRLDEDLRKKFDSKVFVIIFQQTTTGRTKGGSEVVFDGDIIIKMVKGEKFADNYAFFDKNRYTKVPTETLAYNIAGGYVFNPLEENKEVSTNKETTQPKKQSTIFVDA